MAETRKLDGLLRMSGRQIIFVKVLLYPAVRNTPWERYLQVLNYDMSGRAVCAWGPLLLAPCVTSPSLHTVTNSSLTPRRMALNGTVPCVPSSASSKTGYVIIAASQRGTHTSPDLRLFPPFPCSLPAANLDGFFCIWRQLCSSSILHLWTSGQAGSFLGWWMPWTENNRYIRGPSKMPLC